MNQPLEETDNKSKFSFPSAHTVLLIIAAFVALLTWLVPAGKYDQLEYKAATDNQPALFIHHAQDGDKEYPGTQATLDDLGMKIDIKKFEDGAIWKAVGIPGTYHVLKSNPQGIEEFIQSPLKGIMEAIDVILFVLIIGGFIGIVNHTGAFDAGVASLARRLKGRETWLIIIISSLIAIGGTTFGLAEETIAFYPILVPVFLAARYDAMVALATIYIGSSMGTMASTVNPFSAIIASNSAGINWTSGLYGRLTMLVLGMGICLWYIIRYAERVRKDPSKSIIYEQKAAIEAQFMNKNLEKDQAFTLSTQLVLVLFVLSFVAMIFGVSIRGWWFMEMTTVFFVGAILIGLVAKIKEKVFVEQFVKGANDLLNVALIIGLARGVTVLMDEGLISDTLLYYASGTVEGMPKAIFANVMMFLYAGLSFFIPSSSGMAVLSMPIMAPLADVVAAPREIVVDAYQYGMGLMAFITPTGLILASLTMVNVTYDKWIKFVLPLLIILTIFSMFYLTLSVYLF
ncbi:YfcC family protein [Aureispira anguillae]|uniref:YfcC family protein n=1 Tax=Aureispira anguillae TaxID=2864201 RepID=A0A915YHS3_9BACT|nr:YfcC family protein [Aureispira anguillae]BDS13430.1 YfcC family protein [Aureispira anguillae]